MEENESSQSSSQIISLKKTPKHGIVHQHIGTPLQRIKDSEINQKERQSKTPVAINPFEVKADSLYFPSCSPSVFATFARNKTNNGQFRWSIDHVSLLYPADIDETSIPDTCVDPDHETQAQKAIDAFFSQNSIVPSPWSSESKERREAKARRTTRMGSVLTYASDAATQTKLTIPPTFDLLSLLGEEFHYNEEYDTAYSSPTSSNGSLREMDVMSTSSLRRKLFAAEEDCKTPSRLEQIDLLPKQWSSPRLNSRSIQSTPSDLLSSSPKTPPICSESCNVRTSPQMSPIAGPPSHKSIRMRSFNERLDEESNSQPASKPSSQYNHTSENSMSFYMDSQDTGTFQSYASEKQDTGYVTGSMFSLQSMTSDTTSGFQSHITPVAELLDDYGLSNTESNMSYASESNTSIDDNLNCKVTEPVLWGSNKWSLVPENCSTPTFNL